NAARIKTSADTLHELLCTANMKLFAERCAALGNTKMDISSTSVKVSGNAATDSDGRMVNINCRDERTQSYSAGAKRKTTGLAERDSATIRALRGAYGHQTGRGPRV